MSVSKTIRSLRFISGQGVGTFEHCQQSARDLSGYQTAYNHEAFFPQVRVEGSFIPCLLNAIA